MLEKEIWWRKQRRMIYIFVRNYNITLLLLKHFLSFVVKIHINNRHSNNFIEHFSLLAHLLIITVKSNNVFIVVNFAFKRYSGQRSFILQKALIRRQYWSLQLCHCAGENLAIQGKATQSSLHSIGVAYNAIDGSRANNWNQASCSHTNADFTPWWRLDMGKAHKVFSINITNQRDGVPQRINGAEIRIGNSLDNNGNNNPRYFTV